MADYSAKLKAGEDILETFIARKANTAKVEQVLGSCLTACNFMNLHKNFTVIITKKNLGPNDPFFGVITFPAINKLDGVAQKAADSFTPFKVISEMWRDIEDWVVEIDPRLITDRHMGLNHKEIMACLLHEVGHAVYSDRIPSKIMRAKRGLSLSAKTTDKAALRAGYVLFKLPILAACTVTNIPNTLNSQHEEYFADKIAKECGYGEYIVSALDKIIAAYGIGDVATGEVIADKQIDAEAQWAMRMVQNMTERRNRLASDLFIKGAKSNSEYMKEATASIIDEVGVATREIYTGDAVESIVALRDPDALTKYKVDLGTAKYSSWDICVEGAITTAENAFNAPAMELFGSGKLKKGLPSWRDIDNIQFAIERIRTNDDRQLVLDIIYSHLEEIKDFMELARRKGKANRFQAEADRMVIALDRYREQVLNRRIDPNAAISSRSESFQRMVMTGNYKYPAGYEG